MRLRLRELRTNRGLTLQELANQSRVSLMAIQRAETGKTEPRLVVLERLARALGVGIVDLFEPEAPRKRRRKA